MFFPGGLGKSTPISAALNKQNCTLQDVLDVENFASVLKHTLPNSKYDAMLAKEDVVKELYDFALKEPEGDVVDVKRGLTLPMNAADAIAAFSLPQFMAHIGKFFAVLEGEPPLHDGIANIWKQILAAQFNADPDGFSEAFAESKILSNPEVLRNFVRHIAASSALREAFFVMMGADVPVEDATNGINSAQPTQVWLDANFIPKLARYCGTVFDTVRNGAGTVDPDAYIPYFTFIQEIVRRALSLQIGALADAFFDDDVLMEFCTTVVGVAHQYFAAVDAGGAEAWEWEGVGLLLPKAIAVLNEVLESTEAVGVNESEPIPTQPALVGCAEQLLSCLACTGDTKRVGTTRHAIIAFTFNLLARRDPDIDDVVFEARALKHCLSIVERFPTNDVVSQFVCFRIARMLSPSDISNVPAEQQAKVIKHLIEDVDLPGFMKRAWEVKSLRAAAAFLWTGIPSNEFGAAIAWWSEFEDSALKPKWRQWRTEITGAEFSEPETGCVEPVLHRPEVQATKVLVVPSQPPELAHDVSSTSHDSYTSLRSNRYAVDDSERPSDRDLEIVRDPFSVLDMDGSDIDAVMRDRPAAMGLDPDQAPADGEDAGQWDAMFDAGAALLEENDGVLGPGDGFEEEDVWEDRMIVDASDMVETNPPPPTYTHMGKYDNTSSPEKFGHKASRYALEAAAEEDEGGAMGNGDAAM